MNDIYVIKRNGDKSVFNPKKIAKAINKAYKAWGKTLPDTALKEVVTDVTLKCFDGITVEEIQDYVVSELELKCPSLATVYSTYRAKHEELRNANIKRFDDAINSITEEKINDVTRENSNRITTEIATKMQLIGEETCKFMNFQTDPDIKDVIKLHNKGVIHVHDTAYWGLPATNCHLINFQDILQNGTVINGVQINKPHSLQVAATIVTQVMSKWRKDSYGGMSFNISDLAPFVYIDRVKLCKEAEKYGIDDVTGYVNDHLKKNVEAAVQTINYQIQTLSDDIFVTIALDLYSDESHINDTYMLIEEFLKQRIKGMPDEKGQLVTQSFPKLIFVLYESMFKKDTSDHQLMLLAAESTAKRMSPDFVSAKKSKEYKEGNIVIPMGCRSFLQPWKDKDNNYKFWGRGNLGVVTINLPYIALDNKFNGDNTIKGFKSKLQEVFSIALKAHKKRISTVINAKVNVAPILWMYGGISRAKDGTLIKDIVKDGYFSCSIGYVGLAETVEALGLPYVTNEGQVLGLEILKYLNELCEKARQEDPLHIYYSIYGTPMESSVKKFANSIKRFPLIPHVNDRKYITNSYHVPVEYNIDAFHKLDFESPFQQYSTGGAISYCESGNLEKNIPAVVELLKEIYDKMLYAEINVRHADTCHVCDYHGEIQFINGKWTCPNCGNTDITKMTRVRRTCGYLSSNDWNTARTDEINSRVIHIQ